MIKHVIRNSNTTRGNGLHEIDIEAKLRGLCM